MEMKAVTEYETPNYDTYEEKKNKIFRFVMNMPKISIGMLVLFLISSNSYGVPISNVAPGGLEVYTEKTLPISTLIDVLIGCAYWASLLIMLILIILVIIDAVKLRKIEDEEEIRKIKKRKKRRNICLIFAIVIFLTAVILNIVWQPIY